MNLMQLIKLVLDEAYSTISESNIVKKDVLIKAEIEALASEYGNLINKDGCQIDYSDPVKRFAYIYKYTVAHADYLMQLIKRNTGLSDLLAKQSVAVACLGGGPGSDLLGILKYLIQNDTKNIALTCYIFDKERAWGDSWSDVASTLKPPFQVYPVFQQLDVTDSATWKSYQKFLQADLFTLSYFLSEIWKIQTEAEQFFNHCLSQMKTGSMILFVDNNDSRFYEWFDAMANKHKLVLVASSCGDLCFSNDEEKTDLGIYFEKFGWPKRRSNAAWRIMKKA